MTREQEDKFFDRGCLATVTGSLIALILTFVRDYSYALLFLGFLGLGWMIGWVREARNRRVLERIRDQVFQSFPGAKPRLEITSSYAFPHITLCFELHDEVTRSEELGCIAAFKLEVQSLYGHLVGTGERPFDVDYGVSVKAGEHHVQI